MPTNIVIRKMLEEASWEAYELLEDNIKIGCKV
jgi:hypothetical protein